MKRAGVLLQNEEKKKKKCDNSGGEKKKRRRVRKHDEEKEAEDERRFVEITTYGKKIMPKNIIKYTGSVSYEKATSKHKSFWTSRFRGQYSYIVSKSHNTQEDAYNRVIELNRIYNLPIKNIIYEYKEEFYCVLTKRQIMKFSFESMDLVESRNWCAAFAANINSYYASSTIDNKMTGFHRLVCANIGIDETVDHINRHTLDNTVENIRASSSSVQNINRSISIRNTSKVVGVCYDKANRCWYANWRETGKLHGRRFYGDDAFAKATEYRKEKEQTIDNYKIALSK